MTADASMAKSALIWGTIAAVVGSLVGRVVGGPDAAFSIGIPAVIVLANVAASAWFAGVGARLGGVAALNLQLISLGVRMLAIVGILAALQDRSFIDPVVFFGAFGSFLTGVLILQSRSWKRTPWLARAFGPTADERRSEKESV